MAGNRRPGRVADRWYGMVGVTQSLAASISGLLASLVIASTGEPGFRAVIALNVGCLLVSALMLSRVPQRRRIDADTSAGGGYRSVLKDAPFVWIVGGNTLFILCSMLPGIGLAIYVTDALHAPLWTVGALGIVQTGLVIGFQMRVLRVVEGIRRTRVMQFAGCVWVVACLLFAGAGVLPGLVLVPWLILSVALFTLAQLLYVPTAQLLAASLGPPALQGRYVATYELSWGLARAMSPALFGITFDLFPAAPWLAMVAVVVCAMVVLRSAEVRMPGAGDRTIRAEPIHLQGQTPVSARAQRIHRRWIIRMSATAVQLLAPWPLDGYTLPRKRHSGPQRSDESPCEAQRPARCSFAAQDLASVLKEHRASLRMTKPLADDREPEPWEIDLYTGVTDSIWKTRIPGSPCRASRGVRSTRVDRGGQSHERQRADAGAVR